MPELSLPPESVTRDVERERNPSSIAVASPHPPDLEGMSPTDAPEDCDNTENDELSSKTHMDTAVFSSVDGDEEEDKTAGAADTTLAASTNDMGTSEKTDCDKVEEIEASKVNSFNLGRPSLDTTLLQPEKGDVELIARIEASKASSLSDVLGHKSSDHALHSKFQGTVSEKEVSIDQKSKSFDKKECHIDSRVESRLSASSFNHAKCNKACGLSEVSTS
jgi:hypothetical protein